jgi:hypothetical protein
MKKLLSLVLVLSLVLGSVAFAFATPADVVGTDYDEAVTRLEALGILTGYADGSFKPENTITRAEYAAVVVRALGLDAAAIKGATAFTDVPATHWASGYINIASGLEVVNGYGNAMFGPEDAVTYEQAVTMAVRALGYEPKAADMGGYPNGYLAVAAEEDITDGVAGVVGSPASRGIVALLIDNSLEVNLMERTGYGDDEIYEVGDMTLLADKLDATEIEARVDAVPLSDSDLDSDEVALDGETYQLLTADDANSYFGLEVTAWVNDDDEIFYMTVETDEDDIYYDEIVKVTDDDVELLVEDDTFDFASGADVFMNFEAEDEEDLAVGAFGRFVMDDDEVVFASVFNFASANGIDNAVVTDVDGDEVEYAFGSDSDTVEFDNYDDVYVFTAEMMEADVDDIDVDNAMFAWEGDDDDLYIVVGTETVEGELTAIKSSSVKVDGSYVDTTEDVTMISTDQKDDIVALTNDNYEDFDAFMDEEVVMVLDLNGDALLVYTDADAVGDTIYGVVTWADDARTSTLYVFTNADEEMEYDFETRADVGTLDDENDTNAVIAAEFELNKDGEIDDGSLTTTTTKIDLTKDTDSDRIDVEGSSNRYYIDEDTIFIDALDSDLELDPALLDYEDVYDNAFDSLNAIVIGTEGKTADMIVFVDNFEGTEDDTYYAVALDDSFESSDDYYAELAVYGEGTDEYLMEEKTTEGDLFSYIVNSDDEVVATSTVPTKVIKTELTTTTAYSSGYFTYDNEVIKVASDVLVYALESDEDKDIDYKTTASKLDDFDNVEYLLDTDFIMVAAIVYDDVVDGGTTTTDEDDLTITYINTADDQMVAGGLIFKANADTVIKSATGVIIGLGDFAALTETDVINVEGDVYTIQAD